MGANLEPSGMPKLLPVTASDLFSSGENNNNPSMRIVIQAESHVRQTSWQVRMTIHDLLSLLVPCLPLRGRSNPPRLYFAQDS
jgi:hypothetical protein